MTGRLRFLVTNDDGVEAPGLRMLRDVLGAFGSVVVLAPLEPHSGCSHRATTDRPLRLTDRGEDWYALDGTPVDCTRVGLRHLAGPFDWVVAGVNDGGNLGTDVLLSGTVAAVREAALLGCPGLAISHYRRKGSPVDWRRAAAWVERVVGELLARELAADHYWNVNLPDPVAGAGEPRLVDCPLDTSPLPVRYVAEAEGLRYRGNYQERPRRPEGDVAQCFGGAITVSRLAIDVGHRDAG